MKIRTEISSERLAENFHALERIAAGADARAGLGTQAPAVLAVVKANAYGHGIDPCAAILAGAGAQWLGVTDAQEGVSVRRSLAAAGIVAERQPEVLVMCGTAGLAGEAERMVGNRLTPTVWTVEHLERLVAAAVEAGAKRPVAIHLEPVAVHLEPVAVHLEPVAVHLEIDTGMSRQGVRPGIELAGILEMIAGEPRLALTGVFTHFASTEIAGSPQTVAQQKSFEAAMAQMAASGLRPQWVHAGNSSYVDNQADEQDANPPLAWLRHVAERAGARAMVRSGLALYGYLLPIEGRGRSLARAAVRPVMTWKTRVIAVSAVNTGAAIGYNGTQIALRPMRLALLPVGYADGLRRELSGSDSGDGGWVMLRGQRAAIVGRISMNLTTIDVTEITDVLAGEEVVLLGEGITADDHARLAGTIAYEILCGVRTSF